MIELEIIQAVRKHLKPSPRQKNRGFASDAEIVEIQDGVYAFTADEFSAEDGFSFEDPLTLGWNLVIATLSDLLAVGATPCLMLNSLVVDGAVPAATIETMGKGMQEALDCAGAFMLGGDAGTADAWRVTGFGVGTFAEGKAPLSRLNRASSGAVLATGSFGDGNLAAAGLKACPRFECRRDESKELAGFEAACIDTSDGLILSLEALVRVNPNLEISLDTERVPYAEGAKETAAALGIPRETVFLGSGGEYELVALVPEKAAAVLVDSSGFSRIGSFARGEGAGVYMRDGKTGERIKIDPLPDPREFQSLEEYRVRVVELARKFFSSDGE